VNGRSDLAGPLAQLGLGRDGTYYIIAAGRANHAGAGSWQGITTGNTSFIGIEGENAGTPDDAWPEVQMDAYRRGVAAILKHVGRGAEFCAGHKEYALPKGRKPDPLFDMDVFRAAVADIIRGAGVVRPPIPPAEPAQPGGAPGRPTLRRGDNDAALVKVLQKKLRLPEDGVFGPNTEAAVRVFQRSKGLVPDGIVGPKSWLELDTL
jgi:peptidoglycan hydrolase-like protein with peptidoglycan-binding domain